MRRLAIVCGLACLMAGGAAAQTVGTPVFMAPYRAFKTSELSGTLAAPGKGWSLEGAYRYGSGKFDIGIRAGVWSADAGPEDTDTWLLVGADVRFRVIDHTDKFPLDGALTAGVGGQFGSTSIGYIPIGLSLGRRIELDGGASFVPYIQPVIVPIFGDRSELGLALGLGVDFKVSKQFDLRLTGGVGDIQGIGIGFAWVR